MGRPSGHRRIGAAATALGLVMAATGCGLFDGGAGPDDLAEDLASALSSGNLERVEFAGARADVRKRWRAITEDLEDTARNVRVVNVDRTGDASATAELAWSWRLGDGQRWSYRTTATLTNRSRWVVEFEPTLVEPSLDRGEALELSTTPARRGEILGAGGRALVTERPVVRFGIDKGAVGPDRQAESARRLAELLEVDADDLVKRVSAAGERAFVEALVLRKEEAAGVDSYDTIPGVLAVTDEIPLAPSREFARSLLGTVGPVTAELIEQSDGAYDVGDEAGLSGLQARYEDSLAGASGLRVAATSEHHDKSRTLFEAPAKRGTALRTTLDLDLQQAAEGALEEVDPPSALVAIRPSDGHILAAADGPGSAGHATAAIGRYPPGSTFKLVTVLALLRGGMSPEQAVSCTDTTTVDGKSFENYDDYPANALGDIKLRTAFAHSCNTSFVRAYEQVDQRALSEAAAALGMGVDQDLGFPAYLGSVPTKADATGRAAAMIGQGKLLASPLAMATVAASVAEGTTVVPRLLPERDGGDFAQRAKPLGDGEAEQLRSMLRSVVTDGSADFLADVPGEPVLAKTGTAEFGEAVPPDTHAWMIASRGDLAVAVFVERSDSGSHDAGPVLEEFLRSAS